MIGMSIERHRSDKIRELAASRRKFDLNTPDFKVYRNLHDFHNGAYECDFVVPWTKSACNYKADVMLVAQDWASSDFLQKGLYPCVVECGHDPDLDTNKNLKRLLQDHLELEFRETYATDAFPFIKPGGMGTRIKRKAFDICVAEFLLKQIEIIEPGLVICIGRTPYDGICRVAGLSGSSDICQTIIHPIAYGTAKVVRVAHTGFWGTRSRGDQVEQDWNAVKQLLETVQRERRRKANV